MRSKQYKFTVGDIAKAARVAVHTTYRDIRLGRLDPTSLPSVVKWVSQRRDQK